MLEVLITIRDVDIIFILTCSKLCHLDGLVLVNAVLPARGGGGAGGAGGLCCTAGNVLVCSAMCESSIHGTPSWSNN